MKNLHPVFLYDGSAVASPPVRFPRVLQELERVVQVLERCNLSHKPQPSSEVDVVLGTDTFVLTTFVLTTFVLT